MDLFFSFCGSCGILFLENLLSQQEDIQHYKEGGKYTKAHYGFAQTLGAYANQKEEGEAKENCPGLMVNKVVAGLSFKLGVYLAEEYHTC